MAQATSDLKMIYVFVGSTNMQKKDFHPKLEFLGLLFDCFRLIVARSCEASCIIIECNISSWQAERREKM